MSAVFQKQLSKSYLDMYDGVDTSQSSFSENFGAGRKRAIHMSNTSSKSRSLQDAWQPFIDEINSKSEKQFKNPAFKLRRGVFGTYLAPSDTRKEYNGSVSNILDFLKSNEEMYGKDMSKLTHDFIINRAIEIAKHESEQYEDVADRSASWLNGPARFLGEIVGTFDDPVQQDVIAATAGLGALVNGTRTIGGIMIREAMIGAGTEVFIQKEVADWYKELDLPYTIEDFALNVTAAGALSASFPLAFKVGGATVKLTMNQAKKGYQAIKSASARLGQKVSANAETAESLMDQIDATVGTSPIKDADEHFKRVDASEDSLVSGQEPEMANQSISTPTTEQLEKTISPKKRETISDLYTRFELEDVNVDAQSYQFKDGSDEFGVTEQLRGDVQWNQEQSGVVLIHEKADGKLFIADGHQRLALAKRIKQKDPSQDIYLLGINLREKDGISVENAMVRAAVKNIGEGSGTVLDAVKILKGDPTKFKTLPPRTALVRQARNIVKIKDNDAYGLFVNGLVSPQQASIVGQMVPSDKTLQRAAMNVLAKAKPENEIQAQTIVQQVMDSGTEKVNQESLFGNALEEESLYFERAKVLDNAVKILQRDKSAFNTIVKNQTKFESEGNQLARSANEQKIEKDGQAIQLIQTLANRRGQLSDELTAAARIAKQSNGQYGKATESFVNSVRGAVDRGDFNGEVLRGAGRAIDAPPQNGKVSEGTAERNLDDFDDPAGQGSQTQMNQMEADMFPQLRAVETAESVEAKQNVISESDLDVAVPVGQTVDDATGQITVINQTMREIKEEIEYDDKMIERMGICIK